MVVGVCLSLLWPAQSLARAFVRFIHAVPGVGTATVDVNTGAGNVELGSIGFSQVTPWRSIASGSFHWSLVGAGKTLAQGQATVGDGAYDIVVLSKGAGVTLGIYKAEGGKAGTSLVRVIHAAPELGSPELMLDSKTVVKSLAYTQATPYLSVTPGMHTLGAMKAGDSAPLVSNGGVTMEPGMSYSAIVVGSRGERVRVVTVVDRGAAPTQSAATQQTQGSASSAKSVVVASGDSLWSIAKGLLPAGASNASIWHLVVSIWDLNVGRIGTGNPNLIFPGVHLLLPSL